MKQKTLLLMVGVPGAGKSSWIKWFTEGARFTYKVISRDAIRYSLLQPGEDYFSHEDEVVPLFYKAANEALQDEVTEYIILDATHLSCRARGDVLKHLHLLEGTKVIPVVFNIPLDICLAQNAQRSGRARVPEDAIRKMYRSLEIPEAGGWYYDVWMVTPNWSQWELINE